MREYNTRTVFVGKLLSARTPPENLLTIELKYQVMTNYRNTPVGDTITVYRPDGCDVTTESYQQFIGKEHLIYPIYNMGSYAISICAEFQLPPPESVENWKKKLPLAQEANRLDIVEICNNVVHTWQLIEEVKQRGNKMIKSYYPNGVLEAKGKLKNSMPDGEWKYYDDKGRLLEKTTYREGIKWGESKYFYYENDTLIGYGSTIYENDLFTSGISFYPNGSKAEEYLIIGYQKSNSYKKSLMQTPIISIEIQYRKDGSVREKREQKLLDAVTRETETIFTFFYENGQIKEKHTKRYSKELGDFYITDGVQFYSEDGKLINNNK